MSPKYLHILFTSSVFLLLFPIMRHFSLFLLFAVLLFFKYTQQEKGDNFKRVRLAKSVFVSIYYSSEFLETFQKLIQCKRGLTFFLLFDVIFIHHLIKVTDLFFVILGNEAIIIFGLFVVFSLLCPQLNIDFTQMVTKL